MPELQEHGARFGGNVLRIPVHGGDVEVEAMGAGPPVLLLHGWTLDRRIWTPQAVALAKNHRVVALDRRGFGRSSAPPDLPREPIDVLAVADALRLDRFALVGMSQGARVALAFAIRHPQRVTAMVLQGAPLSDVPPDPGEAEDAPAAGMRALAAAGELARLRRTWLDHALMRTRGRAAARLAAAVIDDYAARDLLAPTAALEVREADCRGMSAPTLAVTGDLEPPWRHKVAKILAEAIPGAERVALAEAGHLANLCQPETYNRLVREFLARALPEDDA